MVRPFKVLGTTALSQKTPLLHPPPLLLVQTHTPSVVLSTTAGDVIPPVLLLDAVLV